MPKSLLLAFWALTRCCCFSVNHLNILRGSSECWASERWTIRSDGRLIWWCGGGRRAGCQAQHLHVPRLHCLRFVVADDHCIVGVAPGDRRLVDFNRDPPQVRNVYALVILFVNSFENNLLLLVVNLDDVVVFGVGQVAYAPLKALICVLAYEDWIGRRCLHQVLLRVKSTRVFANFKLPCRLAKVPWALPFAQQ